MAKEPIDKNKIVVISGAGISVTSGLQTFRDCDGLWRQFSIKEPPCRAGRNILRPFSIFKIMVKIDPGNNTMEESVEQTNLREKLSFSHCKDISAILAHSYLIAEELMNNWKIVSKKGERRFWGLEFYLHIPGIFEDDATHKRIEQLNSGTFYFHSKSKGYCADTGKPNWTYPIFNRHGVDITCGDQQHIYGGILLRHLGGEGHRDGSGLALRSLMRGDAGFKPIKRGSPEHGWSGEEKAIFERMNNQPIFGGEISLEHDPLSKSIIPQKIPRIGIKKTKFAALELGFRRTA